MAVDIYGNGFSSALQGALGQMYGINQQNAQQNFANNYADAQFGAYRYGLDQSNALAQAQLAAQQQYLRDQLGLGRETLTSQTGLANRGLDLQGTLGNRNLDILSQEQANKLAVANSRNEILKSLLGGFGNWFGGGQTPSTGATAGAPIGAAGSPLGGAATFAPPQYSGFTTNYGQSAGYTPGPRQMPQRQGAPQQGAQQQPSMPPAAPQTLPPTGASAGVSAANPQAQVAALLAQLRAGGGTR